MKIRLLMSLILLASGMARAEDFTLANGTVLLEASVRSKTSEEIQIRHAGGVQKFSYEELSPELQERFEMRPEDVQARRAAAKEAAAEKAARRREADERHRATLEASGKLPRYVDGSDILRMNPGMPINIADYQALQWNLNEARRLELNDDITRYQNQLNPYLGNQTLMMDLADWKNASKSGDKLSKKTEELKETQDELKALKAEYKSLRNEYERLWEAYERGSNNSTLIISDPRPYYVPVFIPHQHNPRPIKPSRPNIKPTPGPVKPSTPSIKPTPRPTPSVKPSTPTIKPITPRPNSPSTRPIPTPTPHSNPGGAHRPR